MPDQGWPRGVATVTRRGPGRAMRCTQPALCGGNLHTGRRNNLEHIFDHTGKYTPCAYSSYLPTRPRKERTHGQWAWVRARARVRHISFLGLREGCLRLTPFSPLTSLAPLSRCVRVRGAAARTCGLVLGYPPAPPPFVSTSRLLLIIGGGGEDREREGG